MIYMRKRHWVTYFSDKCKMYLRNDFKFECAYCGMKEKYSVVGEQLFEKDHFVSRQSDVEWDVNRYDNMVYSCRKCNGTKGAQNIGMILDPCKDDIYEGKHPHIRKLGAEEHYRLQAVTTQGQQFIDDLKLDSQFYRKMRRMQAENEEMRKAICQLLEQSPNLQLSGIDRKIKIYLQNGSLVEEESDEFRCGTSKAGEAVYAVLQKLKEKGIKYKLLFTDDDLDISVEYCGNTYHCEIRVVNYPSMKKKRPIVERKKKEEWQKTGNVCGVLCFYKKQDIMNLYIYPDDERTEIVKLE